MLRYSPSPPSPRLPCRAAEHLPLHALNKLPYGKLAGHKIGVKEGVIFLTYSSLISSSGEAHLQAARALRIPGSLHGHVRCICPQGCRC